MATDLETLARIEQHVCAVASRSRDVLQVGPFRAFLTTNSDEYLLNLAVPVAHVEDWSRAIDDLDNMFRGRRRRPRLEYFDERYPLLAPALRAAGYHHDMTAPVMVLSADTFTPQPEVANVRYSRLTTHDDDLLDAFLNMQSRAYGMSMADAGWRPMMKMGLADGRIEAVALEIDGVLVSGASLILGGGLSELAGVGTMPGHQRLGLAADVCTRLLRAHFEAGHELCWLSAAEGAKGVYERLGFTLIGTQHNFGRPARASTQVPETGPGRAVPTDRE